MTISRDTFDSSKNYKRVRYQQDRDLLDSELNEAQDIAIHERKKIADLLFRDGAIIGGLVPQVAGNVLTLSIGVVYIDGHIEQVPGSVLTYDPAKTSGVDYVYVELLKYNYGYTQDAGLINPATGEPTAEREKWVLSLKERDTSGDSLPNNVTERKVVPIYKFDRETGEVTSTVLEKSNLYLKDFLGTLPGSRITVASITEDQLREMSAQSRPSLSAVYIEDNKKGGFMRKVAGVGLVVFALFLVAASVSVAALPELASSEISRAVSLPDGSHVSLRLEEIVKIKNDPAYIVIAEPFHRKDRLICLTYPSPELRLGQVIDVEGDLTTLANGARALQNVTVWGYASESGELTYHPSIIKHLSDENPWPWGKIDLTDRSAVSGSSAASVSPDEPNSDPAEGPTYYSRIGNAFESANPQTQGMRTQSFYDGIPDLEGLPAGSLVELQCKRIIGVGTETINGTPYNYLDIAEDLPATDWIRCYYSAGTATTSQRVNKVTGQIQYTNGGAVEVICIDNGPDYNPQILEGKLNLVDPNTVPFVRTQANGASASLTGKVVAANQTDFPGALYVQEAPGSGYFGGIRVRYSGSTIARGSLVDITGSVTLAADGEREINAGSTGVSFVEQSTVPGPLGMPNKHLGGGDFNVYTPGVSNPDGSGVGLHNKGLLVKIWGKVTAVDAGNKFFYIDDGTGFQDGSGNTGVKISWAWSPTGKPSILPPAVDWYVSVIGLSSSDTADSGATFYRVLRPREQSDITVHKGGTPLVIAPAPAWAADVIPVDSSPVGDFGPSSADSVDLATGAGENNPAPDIAVENPLGPDVEFSRSYRSTTAEAGYSSSGLSTGWVHNYDVRIQGTTGSWSDLTLIYPNGAQETLDVDASGGNPVFVPTGAPYVVTGQAGGITGQWDWVQITFADETSWKFTAPNPAQPDSYLLSQISDSLGHYVTINRVSTTDTRLSSVTSDASNTLISFSYSGGYLSTVSDVSVAGSPREVTYTFALEAGTTVLKTVSQVNIPAVPRWGYTYTQINGHPYLTWVEVPDPTGASGMRGHPINYDGNGKVSSLVDANGNSRSYIYNSTSTQVFVKDPSGNLAQCWTQKISPNGQNAGVIDAEGNATSIEYYSQSYRPWRIYNKNGQCTELTSYDNYGNIRTATNPRGIVTTHNYDSNHPFRLVNGKVGSKPTTTFEYDANGLLWKINTPKPGTVWDGTPGTEQRVTTTLTYTALGNVKTITEPAPSYAIPCVTTVFDYTEDPDYSITGVPERFNQPLRITVYDGVPTYTSSDKITGRIHFRYDSFGRLVEAIDSVITANPDLRHRTNYEYNWGSQIEKIWYPPVGTDPSKRAHLVYHYLYPGGPLKSVDLYDENNANESQPAFRHIEANAGNESEIQELAGNALSRNYAYDALYRAKEFTDGRSHTKQFGYSAVGNPEKLIYPSGKTLKVGFDPDHNLDKRTDGKNRVTDYILDPVDSRLADVDYPAGTAPHIDYDDYGRITMTTDSTGVFEYTYDDNNLVLTAKSTYTGITPKTITYYYYPDGSRERMTISGFSDYLRPSLTYRYYNNYDTTYKERQISVQSPIGFTSYFNYSWNGQIVERKIGTYIRTTYSYDARGCMTALRNGSMTSEYLHSWFTNLSYDPAGNLLRYDYSIANAWRTQSGSVKNLAGNVIYTYDDFDRLVREQRTDNDPAYSFDVSFSFDEADNPESARGQSFSSDEDDQIDSSGYSYDDNGNATQCRGYSFDYDYEDLPTSVAGGLDNITSTYRADGFRASKTVDGEVTYYLYDGDKVVCAFDSESYLDTSYTYGPTGLVTRAVYLQGYSFVPFYMYTFDPLGSLVKAHYYCDGSTDPYGNAHTAIYDAFGKRWWDKLGVAHIYSHGENAEFVDSAGFAGQWGAYSDQETRITEDDSALVLMDDEVYYDPVSVRTVARTAPVRGMNSYARCGNNPVAEASTSWFDNTTNFAAGMGDAISLGLTARVRMWIGVDDVVDRSSGWFKGGTVAGIATDVASGGAVLKIGVKGLKNAGRVASRVKAAVSESSEASAALKALPKGRYAANAGGKIVSFVTAKTERYYRVYSKNRVGGFLTKVKPKNSRYATEGLALPAGNEAKYVQEVVVPAGTRLQRSRCLPAFGRRGGLEQFELLDKIPESSFGPGVPLQ